MLGDLSALKTEPARAPANVGHWLVLESDSLGVFSYQETTKWLTLRNFLCCSPNPSHVNHLIGDLQSYVAAENSFMD